MNALPEERVSRLVDRLLAGDPAALARAVTAVENERPAAAKLLQRLQPDLGRALTVGFTGPPGVGKSTLISAFTGEMRRRERSVAVLAVDPSSPVSGGAILGDRIRMAEHYADPGVFIRSLAARGHLGGLTRTAARVVDLLDGAGWGVIVIETVGAGQSEVEISQVATTSVVITAPGLGDDVQAIKAGILEIADILVVNKADLPNAGHARRALEAMLELRAEGSRDVPVVDTVAVHGEGIAGLADAVEHHQQEARPKGREQRIRSRILSQLTGAVSREAARRLHHLPEDRLRRLIDAIYGGEMDIERAAKQALDNGRHDAALGEDRS